MKETDTRFDPEEIDTSGITLDDIIMEVHAENGIRPKTAPNQDLSALLGKFGATSDAPSVTPVPARRQEKAASEGEVSTGGAKADLESGEQDPSEGFDIREFEPDLDEDDYPDPAEGKRGDEEYEEYEDEDDGSYGRSSGGGIFSREVMILLFSSLTALLLIGIAVVPDLLDPFWSILVITGIVIECVPPVIWTYLYFKDKGRSLAPAMMLLAAAFSAIAAELVEVGVALAIFNVCFLFFDRFSRQKIGAALDRLYEKRDGMDPARDMRMDSCIKDLESGRVKSVVTLRRLELLTLAGMLALSVLFTLIPALFDHMNFMKWAARASVIMVVCVFGGELGALMSTLNAVESVFDNGLWIGGTGVIDAAADVTSVLFNKSGTLTDGEYKVINIDPVRLSEDQLLYLAVYAGAYSEHPLNRALREYTGITPDKSRIGRQRIEPGYGSLVQLEDDMIIGIGNIDFMEKLGVKGDLYVAGETCVFVSVGRVCVGRIDFADTIRPDAVTVVHDLRRAGVANVAVMTGDNALSATNTGRRVGISEVYSDCRPGDKLERLQYILDTQEKGDRTCFVTSAGSERELLEISNLSVTLGVGNDATAAFPDVIISNKELSRLPKLMRISREVRRNLTSTFFASTAVRILVVILGMTGVLTLWLATLIMMLLLTLGFLNSNVKA